MVGCRYYVVVIVDCVAIGTTVVVSDCVVVGTVVVVFGCMVVGNCTCWLLVVWLSVL